ncbi:MAG: uracil-DNA glycosylase [Deferribacteraceae bacterium]|nr:uracil-DNA glycosylase [Deferribacteraceae bacterium]
MKDKKINCFKCKYLRITWQPKFPYACDALGFKSKMIPSLEVFKNSNMPCQMFAKKDGVDK